MRAALAEVPEDAAVMLVHDAARPLVSDEVIERVLTALNDGWDGAVPGLPSPDTVKRVDGDAVEETLDREGLAPCRRRRPSSLGPPRRPRERLAELRADCAALVEARGGRVAVVEGDRGCSRSPTPTISSSSALL